jgi:hypothetical protein
LAENGTPLNLIRKKFGPPEVPYKPPPPDPTRKQALIIGKS